MEEERHRDISPKRHREISPDNREPEHFERPRYRPENNYPRERESFRAGFRSNENGFRRLDRPQNSSTSYRSDRKLSRSRSRSLDCYKNQETRLSSGW